MCYVYSPEEFRDGRIPSAVDYESARHELTEGLAQLVASGFVHGAVLLGSFTYSDFQIGSDIDLLVVTASRGADDQLRDLAFRITDATNVHLDPKVVTRMSAETGRHRLSYYYFMTTKDFCGDWLIGNDPITVIAPRKQWSNPRQELLEELDIRLEALTKARLRTRADFGRAHCTFLDRIMTLPIYAAINVVRLAHGGQPSRDGQRLSKAETCALYEKLLPGEATGILMEILRRKREYRAALVTPSTSIETYRFLVSQVDAAYSMACDFLELNCSYLADRQRELPNDRAAISE